MAWNGLNVLVSLYNPHAVRTVQRQCNYVAAIVVDTQHTTHLAHCTCVYTHSTSCIFTHNCI